MDGKRFLPYALVLAGLLASTDTSRVVAANMRSFIEAVRRKAAVVYVGSVKEVQLLTRTKFDIKARAVVEVSAVARGSGNPREATFEYSSFDVVFANSFASTIPPGYLLQGSSAELLQRLTAFHDSLSKMSPDQLKVNEINEQDRRIQLELYEKVRTYVRTSK